MLKKLFKYDFKSVGRFGVPVLIALLGTALIGTASVVGMILSFRSGSGMMALLGMGLTLLLMLVFMVISFAILGVSISVLVDYYKSLVTDEAYLTFTLPVRPATILWSKLLNSMLWHVIAGISTLLVSGLILFAGFAASGSLWDILSTLGELIQMIPFSFGGVLMVILILLLLVASLVNTQLLYFFAIFFGSVVAKKHKLLWVIGSVLIVNMVYSTVSSFVYNLAYLPIIAADIAGGSMVAATNIMLAIFIVLLSGMSALFFFLTKLMMEKKLNLA